MLIPTGIILLLLMQSSGLLRLKYSSAVWTTNWVARFLVKTSLHRSGLFSPSDNDSVTL